MSEIRGAKHSTTAVSLTLWIEIVIGDSLLEGNSDLEFLNI